MAQLCGAAAVACAFTVERRRGLFVCLRRHMRMDTYTTAADAHDPDKWLAQLHDLWNIAFFFGQEASNSFKKGGCCDHRAITALLPCCTLHAHRYSRCRIGARSNWRLSWCRAAATVHCSLRQFSAVVGQPHELGMTPHCATVLEVRSTWLQVWRL